MASITEYVCIFINPLSLLPTCFLLLSNTFIHDLVIEGSIYDQGFWYMERSKDPGSTKWIAIPMCDPVRVALQTFSFLQRGVIDPFSESIAEEQRGSIFQDCFRDVLSFFSTCKLKMFDYGTQTPCEISLLTTRMAYNVTSLDSPRPPVSGTCSFWLNGIKSFPGFDFAWLDVVNRTVCLISVSISSVSKHEKEKESPLMKAMCNSFDGFQVVGQPHISDDFTDQSSTAKLLSWLTDLSWKTRYHVGEKKKIGKKIKKGVSGEKVEKSDKDTLDAVMDPMPSDYKKWTHHFIFFSGQKEEQSSSNRLTNLLVAGPTTSAAFLRAPIHSVNMYLNKLEESKQKKASKIRDAEELDEAPPKKKAKHASKTMNIDDDGDEE